MDIKCPRLELFALLPLHKNTLFPSCPKPLFQSEAKCEAIDLEIFFYSHANTTHFHKKILHLASF